MTRGRRVAQCAEEIRASLEQARACGWARGEREARIEHAAHACDLRLQMVELFIIVSETSSETF